MASFTRLSAEQIETLSEIVFGLSITFSAIQFAFNPPKYVGDILTLIVEFAISFTILIWVWITYVRIVSNLGEGRAPPLFLTIVLLLLATVEPYLLYTVWRAAFVLGSSTVAQLFMYQLAAAGWAVDTGLMLIVLGLLAESTIPREGAYENGRATRAIRSYSRWFYGCGVALWVTAAPPFWILIYSTAIGNADVGVISPTIYLQLILWVPIFVALGYGSYRFGRKLDDCSIGGPALPRPTTAAVPRE